MTGPTSFNRIITIQNYNKTLTLNGLVFLIFTFRKHMKTGSVIDSSTTETRIKRVHHNFVLSRLGFTGYLT